MLTHAEIGISVTAEKWIIDQYFLLIALHIPNSLSLLFVMRHAIIENRTASDVVFYV